MKLLTCIVLAIATCTHITPHTVIIDALALCKSLPATTISNPQEAQEYRHQCVRAALDGNYEKSLTEIMRGLEEFPSNFYLQTQFVFLIDDLAQLYEEPFKIILKTTVNNAFEKLMNEVAQQPTEEYYHFKNEYFHRSQMYEQQYKSGIEMMYHYWGTPEWPDYAAKSYYYQGIAATCYAKQLLLDGNKKKAARIKAQAALVAWSHYFSRKKGTYTAHIHHALTLGILGYKEEMIQALQQSAELINKDLSYTEFQDVITFIDEIQNKRM